MKGAFAISQSDKRPMYLQIMEQVKQRIAVGDWTEGQSIPSIRQLAVDLHISVITVKRAYLELERESVIITHQGRGSRVASTPGLGARLREQEFRALVEHTPDFVTRFDVSCRRVYANPALARAMATWIPAR